MTKGDLIEENEADDEWSVWWDARLAAMESVLGKSDDMVLHSLIPFQMGVDIGGAADVVRFSSHLEGVVYVTSELIGCDDQIENDLGNYELMICHRSADEQWGPSLVGRLAHYTCQAELNPGETMDIGSAVPEGSTISALLFLEFARFEVRDRKAGLLLCLGITPTELTVCRQGRREEVQRALRAEGEFPFTDLHRRSVL